MRDVFVGEWVAIVPVNFVKSRKFVYGDCLVLIAYGRGRVGELVFGIGFVGDLGVSCCFAIS